MGIARRAWGIVAVGLFLLTIVSGAPGGTADPSGTERHVSYVFVSDQSTVTQAGGPSDLFENYSIEGGFELMIDYEARTASFVRVDANLVGDSPFLATRSLNELFNMTQLAGLILDNTMIVFVGKTSDGTDSEIQLFLTFTSGKVELQGSFTPPCCDLFSYGMDAVVKCTYGGGSGERNDPYLIYTAEHMYGVGASGDDWDKHFKLMADIDLSAFDGKDGWPAFNVIGTSDKSAFTGVFDGNGRRISHLTITGKDYVGLFGCVESGGEVKNLGVVDVHIIGAGDYVGGLVGWNDVGIVTQCYSTGAVSGKGYVGGLVGQNNSDHLWRGTVTNCYSTGAVTGSGQYVGGLVGGNWGSVTQCYSTGAVTSTGNYVGGLAGMINPRGTVTQCYSTGTVSGTGQYVGGLAGDNYGGTVTQCYSIGAVSGDGEVGGLVGSGWADGVIACFWDIQTSGQAKSAGGTGKTTAEMQTAKTFLDAGWDFVSEIKNGASEVWQMLDGGGYPVLAIFSGYTPPQLQGLGTTDNPYLIFDALELGAIVYYSPDASYRLATSIDLSGIHWGTAVMPWFAGTFDGNGHTLSHLTIQGGGYLGLFGQLASGAEVKDLGVVDVNIVGSGNYFGGLAGENDGGTVTQCYSTGAVSGSGGAVGGLVGDNVGAVTQCYSAGAVSGSSGVGGLLGVNGGYVTQCYSAGAVSGTDWYVGGLVGYNGGGPVTDCYSTGAVRGTGQKAPVGGLVGGNGGGSVIRCYSTGTVSSSGGIVGGLVGSLWGGDVAGCFWDRETSGQATSAAGIGKTTAEMQTAKTFLEAGWDFVGETANGTEDIWKIVEGLGYPRLSWEEYSGGTGEPNDPYQIATAEDLIALGDTPEDYDKHFVLTGNIDLDPNLPGRKVFDKAVIAPDADPNEYFGFQGTPFTGAFDGNGHTISHLPITGKDDVGLSGWVGLFGCLGYWAEVKDLGVVDVNVTSSGHGGGGLVGWNNGTVTNCYSTGAVSGTGQYSSAGGLVGWNKGFVTQCYSTGMVNGSSCVGGLVGLTYGTVNQCYSTGSVSGNWHVGGLVGSNSTDGAVTQCYSTGAVSGVSDVGGLVGINYSHVTQCYSAGAVSGAGTGGLVGSTDGIAVASFWDMETSGQPTSADGTGKTTAEMQTASTFLDAGWDFVGETANGTEDIWWILEGKDYPRLWWEQGDEASP